MTRHQAYQHEQIAIVKTGTYAQLKAQRSKTGDKIYAVHNKTASENSILHKLTLLMAEK